MTIRAVADKQAEASTTLDLTEVSERKVEFDYLRAFVITLVLFVHASFAYPPLYGPDCCSSDQHHSIFLQL